MQRARAKMGLGPRGPKGDPGFSPVVLGTVGAGTPYSLTDTFANIHFGTSGNLSVALPSAGTYLIVAQIREDLSGLTEASLGPLNSIYDLYDGSSLLGLPRIGSGMLTGASAQNIPGTISAAWLIVVAGAKTITLRGKTTAALGETDVWTIMSDTDGQTSLAFVELSA